MEQIHRKSVYNRIPKGLRFTDVGLLRIQVLNYIRMNEKEFEFIREFRGVSYPQEKDWQNLLSNQATNTVYVEHLAILCTAYFLCVTTETTRSTLVNRLPWNHTSNYVTKVLFLWTVTLKYLTIVIPKGNY